MTYFSESASVMTNAIAITLFALIVGTFVADAVWLHLGLPVMAAKLMDNVIEHVIFWR